MSLGVMALVAMLGGQAQAVTADTFVSSHTPGNSGLATEEALLEGACGCNLTLALQTGISDAQVLTAGSVNYIDVGSNAPGFFLLKFGVGNTGSPTHYIFENDVPNETNFLAWTDQQLIDAGLSARKVNAISHYTFEGSVPEPGSLLLLGAGLAGLGIWRRKLA